MSKSPRQFVSRITIHKPNDYTIDIEKDVDNSYTICQDETVIYLDAAGVLALSDAIHSMLKT